MDFNRFAARILCDTDDRPVKFTRQELGFHLPQERNLRLRDVLERLQVSGRVSVRFISQPPRNLVQHTGQEAMHDFTSRPQTLDVRTATQRPELFLIHN